MFHLKTTGHVNVLRRHIVQHPRVFISTKPGAGSPLYITLCKIPLSGQRVQCSTPSPQIGLPISWVVTPPSHVKLVSHKLCFLGRDFKRTIICGGQLISKTSYSVKWWLVLHDINQRKRFAREKWDSKRMGESQQEYKEMQRNLKREEAKVNPSHPVTKQKSMM